MFISGTRPTSLSRILRLAGLGGTCLALLLAAGCGKSRRRAAPTPGGRSGGGGPEGRAHLQGVGGHHRRPGERQDQRPGPGYLIKQNYKEGDFVKKGQVLFEIDPRPFQAALEQAKGELAKAEGAGHGQGQSGAHQASGRGERGEQKRPG